MVIMFWVIINIKVDKLELHYKQVLIFQYILLSLSYLDQLYVTFMC